MMKILGISGSLLFINHRAQSASMSVNDQISIQRHAICYLFPKEEQQLVQGVISFTQPNFGQPTQIAAVVRGLNPNSLHGIHIHELGDYQSYGAIYNPFDRRHGSPQDKERKVGDLGNIKTDERGNGYLAYEDNQVQLFGDYSVIGRSVCIKASEDDLGRGGNHDSAIDGGSGKIIAQGVIGITNAFKNIAPYE